MAKMDGWNTLIVWNIFFVLLSEKMEQSYSVASNVFTYLPTLSMDF